VSDKIVFYHNPVSRARIVHWMLEEVGAPYDMKVLDFQKGEHKRPEYLAVNPMGKLPAIVHRGTAVTEAAAICAYLADAFPEAGLAPALNDPKRGTYLR
jgi:glutathione S-transferase